MRLVCKSDVSDTASTAADLIAQESSVGTPDMNNVLSSLNALTYPYPTTGLKIVITSVIDDGKGGGKVDWSKANNGTGRTTEPGHHRPDRPDHKRWQRDFGRGDVSLYIAFELAHAFADRDDKHLLLAPAACSANQVTRRPDQVFSGRGRIRPSCTTDATSLPSRV